MRIQASFADKKNPGGDTWYWRFEEFGTATNNAHPFLRPALNNNIDAVRAEFTRSYSEELDKEIAKLLAFCLYTGHLRPMPMSIRLLM